MTQPRKQLVSISDTPYYHIVSRCVRRSYLCGHDKITGESYEHRRQWIEDRIRLLSSIFTIDICSYAVMSNHLHLVVKLNPSEADNNWSTDKSKDRRSSQKTSACPSKKGFTSQLPTQHWHEVISDPTLVDAILGRLLHNAHKLVLKGGGDEKNESKKCQHVNT